jgi:hypothetical protein
MKRVIAFLTGLSVCLAMSMAQAPDGQQVQPASTPDSHEKIVVDMLDVIKGTAKALAKAKDAATGKEVKPELQKLAAQMGNISERLEKIGRPAKEQEAELEKKYKTAVDEAIKDFQAEVQRLLKLDFGKDLLSVLEQKPKAPEKK